MSTLCNPLNREQFNSFPDDSKERGREGLKLGHVSQMLLVACKGLKPIFCQNFKNVVARLGITMDLSSRKHF